MPLAFETSTCLLKVLHNKMHNVSCLEPLLKQILLIILYAEYKTLLLMQSMLKSGLIARPG